MGGVLLKKKKPIIRKKTYTPRNWKTAWSDLTARFMKKKLGKKRSSPDLQKRKSMVSSQKKYKSFKEKIRPLTSIRSAGDGFLPRGNVSLRCQKSCKLNFSTMIGIKKKIGWLNGKVKIYFRKFPQTFLTRKSTGHRMGKGKGKFSARVVKFKKGEAILGITCKDMELFDIYYKAVIKAIPVKVDHVVRSASFIAASRLGHSLIKNKKSTTKRKDRITLLIEKSKKLKKEKMLAKEKLAAASVKKKKK